MKVLGLFLILSFLNFIFSSKIQLHDFSLITNKMYNIQRYYFDVNSTFSFDINFNITLSDGFFHIYLIETGKVPHFDLINNPAFCCVNDSVQLCGGENNSSNFDLNTISKIHRKSKVMSEGGFKETLKLEKRLLMDTLVIICNISKNETISISGDIEYKNPNGYLSFEKLYYPKIFLSFFVLYIFVMLLIGFLKYKYVELNKLSLTYNIGLSFLLFEFLVSFLVYNNENVFGDNNQTIKGIITIFLNLRISTFLLLYYQVAKGSYIITMFINILKKVC